MDQVLSRLSPHEIRLAEEMMAETLRGYEFAAWWSSLNDPPQKSGAERRIDRFMTIRRFVDDPQPRRIVKGSGVSRSKSPQREEAERGIDRFVDDPPPRRSGVIYRARDHWFVDDPPAVNL
jgi:hypothetical protein